MKRMIGQPPYHAHDDSRFCSTGTAWECFPSRKIQKRLVEDVAFFACWQPVITRFPDHLGFSEVTSKGLGRAVPADVTANAGDGKMKLGRVAVDGSKVKANASKHKAMS